METSSMSKTPHKTPKRFVFGVKKSGNDAECFCLTCPLITKADGKKFGKTESGNIWLDCSFHILRPVPLPNQQPRW